METILIRPEDVRKGGAFFYSDKIINKMRNVEELYVMGISNAMSLACSAVSMSSEIAAVYIKEVALDYIPLPILGQVSGIFFLLSQKPEIDWMAEKVKFEENMKLDFERAGQLVVVSKNLETEKMLPLCLWKLARSDRLKIMASGYLINQAASVALEIARGSISKESVAIELMMLSTIKYATPEGEKSATTLEIFLRKGKTTKYSAEFQKLLSHLKKLKY